MRCSRGTSGGGSSADEPPPLVPREHRIELRERIGADGGVVTALDDAQINAAVDAVQGSGAESCAVGLLFAFLNPSHERRVAKILQEKLPGVFVSLSSAVQPEFREYERLSTTVLNAYLQLQISIEDGGRQAFIFPKFGLNGA